MLSSLKTEWEASYQNKDNFVFYPNEEVIRFFARHIRKRVGLDEFKDVTPTATPPRVLDLGCGIGRHVVFAAEMGLDAFGIDLSDQAIGVAHDWVARRGFGHLASQVVQGDIRRLPWGDGHFQFVLSHGVLDSVSLEIAQQAIAEVARVLGPSGMFYCDLISGDSSSHHREFAEEEAVQGAHEHGTIQSFFNFGKIERLFCPAFALTEVTLVRRENVMAPGYGGRYHVVARVNGK